MKSTDLAAIIDIFRRAGIPMEKMSADSHTVISVASNYLGGFLLDLSFDKDGNLEDLDVDED